MHYSGIKEKDVANGVGFGVSLFVSGCTHHCNGCFNPETWSFSHGDEFTDKDMQEIIDLVSRPYVDFFSILGGEPFEPENVKTVYKIIKKLKEVKPELIINIWSGYLFEYLIDNEDCKNVLSLCDMLVDGEFILSQKSLFLKLRGSSNQRVINLKESFDKGYVVLYDEYMEELK